ncbi:MAG: tripartite tricarboxylate transporter TctB family protein [Cohaesibacter sp.]|nr:tripartite tricarboxylate transporter TctB family protein [Cohaesibacter sp.]MCV6601119.1 tripartite tricarboxylate transporter TctB family protein [Cohaesibacter sp.]
MLLCKDRIGGLLLLIFSITYGLLSQKIHLLPFQANSAFHARTMPEVLSVLAIGLSVLVILFPGSDERPRFAGLNWGLGAAFLVLMSAYGFLVRPMGFLLATSLFLMVGFALLGERKLWRLVAVAVPTVFAFWALMTYGLDVFIEPLPKFMRGR